MGIIAMADQRLTNAIASTWDYLVSYTLVGVATCSGTGLSLMNVRADTTKDVKEAQWPSVLEQLHSSTRSDHSWPSVVEQIRQPVPNSAWNDLVDADATAEVGDFDEVCNES